MLFRSEIQSVRRLTIRFHWESNLSGQAGHCRALPLRHMRVLSGGRLKTGEGIISEPYGRFNAVGVEDVCVVNDNHGTAWYT